MKIVKANQQGIKPALKYLKAGKVVIYPTDTCYGLGADTSNLQAVKRMYAVKGRELYKPVHVIVADLKMAKKYAVVDKWSQKLFKKFMPAPITIVMQLRAGKGQSWKILSAKTGTIGIAMSPNKTAMALVKKFGKPLTTTSANFAGEITAYSVNSLLKQYRRRKHQPDLILDGGTLPRRRPTTMVSVAGGRVKIFREGPITNRQILAALKF